MSALVSTIIPVYNRPGLLREAVQSVLDQTYHEIEVVIVDDGSTDETGAVADSLAAQHPDTVRVFHIRNSGPGGAREVGRLSARGEFIQYLDCDDLLLPRKFEIQVTALRENPDCGVAYGYTRLLDMHGTVLAAPYKWTGRTFEQLFPALLVDRWWNTQTPLYRRSVCEAVGAWSDLRVGEDWEYESRVGARRVRLVHCCEYVAETRQHEGERLAGAPMSAVKAHDLVRLIGSLLTSAIAAGVPSDSPEMHHFSRWAFLLARQAGAAGNRAAAKRALGIARRAAGRGGPGGVELLLYRGVASIVGWKTLGTLSRWRDHCLSVSPGRHTITTSDSWRHPDDDY